MATVLRTLRAPGVRRTSTGVFAIQRAFSISKAPRSQVDPSNPDEAHLYKVKRPGSLFKEPMDPNIYLSQNPLYTGPMATQIAFSKRWSLGFMAVGTYVGYLSLDVVGLSTTGAILGLIPLVAPFPLIQYFTGSYVTRIFRVYRKNEPQTYENLTKDETLMVEKFSLFGRSTYGVAIKVKDTYLADKRRGWINWVSVDEKGNLTKMYVMDNMGGIKMDRIWGLIEKNSGVDNGRGFLDEAPGLENSDYKAKAANESTGPINK